jgi:hypothetical protein
MLPSYCTCTAYDQADSQWSRQRRSRARGTDRPDVSQQRDDYDSSKTVHLYSRAGGKTLTGLGRPVREDVEDSQA